MVAVKNPEYNIASIRAFFLSALSGEMVGGDGCMMDMLSDYYWISRTSGRSHVARAQ